MTKKPVIVREHISAMPPYQPIYPLEVLSEELGLSMDQLVKLDANENPYGPIPEVKELLGNLESIHIYPDPESRKIRRMLARHYKIPEESLLIGAGADELIDLTMRVILDPGDTLLNCPPTFGMYAFDGTLNQARVVNVFRKPDFSLDVPALMAAAEQHQPKVVFLASPNNPDGGILSSKDFEKLIELPFLVVVDEAYIQFADNGTSYLSLVKEHSNLVVLQTFSKWAGLAGLRIGFGVFPPDLVSILMKAKQPYNVSVTAEAAAIITMRNLSLAQTRVDQIISQREAMFKEIKAIPWLKPYPSQANFILCQVTEGSASTIKDQLRKQGILIRYFNKPGLEDHVRFSIGTEAQNAKLLSALKGIKQI
jgi:histidinol-phosphate aminotransferase